MAAMLASITVGLFVLGLTHGCSGESQKWQGTWVGDLNRTAPDAPDDYKAHTINLIELKILSDGTFEMMESGIPKSGTVRLGREKAFLTITRVLDRPISSAGSGTQDMNKDLVATWQEDGSILLDDPGGFDAGPVRLTRPEQPSR
jgi:hypothetical protein